MAFVAAHETGAPSKRAADVSITVDKDLLEIGVLQDIVIMGPGEFWRQTSG
jgi:hypothetical protein